MQFGANASNYDKAISVTLLVIHIQRKRINKYEFCMNQWQEFFTILCVALIQRRTK